MGKSSYKNLVNPDKGLSAISIAELNREFYKNYFKDYFGIKMVMLLWMTNSKEVVIDSLQNQSVKKGIFELPKGISLTSEEIDRFVNVELATEYYHCLETFLRLFLSHIEIPKCPWIEISRDTNYANFKNKIKKLADGQFDFKHDNLSFNELVLYIFYGVKDITNTESIELDNDSAVKILLKYISNAAKELLMVYDYNSYKHGLAVFAKKGGFTLGNAGDNVEEHGDCLEFLSKKINQNRLIWNKTSVFTFLDYRCAMMWIYSHLCSNILNIGDLTYNKNTSECEILHIGQDDIIDKFLKMAATPNQFDVVFKQYSIGLIYDSKEKTK